MAAGEGKDVCLYLFESFRYRMADGGADCHQVGCWVWYVMRCVPYHARDWSVLAGGLLLVRELWELVS